jgi:hypothetical protein
MEPALEGTEPTPFPEPAVWPVWKPFTRGTYALAYDPLASSESESTETDATTTESPAAPPPRGLSR